MAQPFDASRLELTGDPRPLAEDTGVDVIVSRAAFSASGTGALLYHSPASWHGEDTDLLLVDRAGKPIRSLGQGRYYRPAFSPEGRRLALDAIDEGTGKRFVWVYDLERNFTTRLTFQGPIDGAPTWSTDGSKVIFISNRKGNYAIYAQSANGAGTTQPLVENSVVNDVARASSDGRYLAYASRPPEAANSGIWILPLFGDKKPYALVQNAFNDDLPQFSPDGKWLAYDSDESGRPEVYVIPFPSGKRQMAGLDPRGPATEMAQRWARTLFPLPRQ